MAERLDGEPSVEVALFAEGGDVVARREGAELRIADGVDGPVLSGDPRVLDHPDAVGRAVAAVRCPNAGEVIVSAGAFNTPQLLMLSGIGDADLLRSAGIEPRLARAGVGTNLQDRYEAAVISAAFIGFMMGATATAIANMQALTKRYGPAPIAFLVVPLSGPFFIDIANAIALTAFLLLPMMGG